MNRFRAAVLEKQPDVIISVYHMELLDLLAVARDLGDIPVLHLGTDMDLKTREVTESARACSCYSS